MNLKDFLKDQDCFQNFLKLNKSVSMGTTFNKGILDEKYFRVDTHKLTYAGINGNNQIKLIHDNT